MSELAYPNTKESIENIDFELRGKYQLLIAATAWELNQLEKGVEGTNRVALALEIDEIEEQIKELKHELRRIIKANPSLRNFVAWRLH